MNINEAIRNYLRHLRVLGRSAYTIRNAKSCLKTLASFMEEEKVSTIEALGKDLLREYQEDLAFRISKRGARLSVHTQSQLLGMAKSFTKFLTDTDCLIHDPGQAIQFAKKPKLLPKIILNDQEVRKIMEAPDLQTNQGYRNRVILELLYDTGIRRAEVAAIKVSDLDLDGGYVRIQGKGNKERVVPLCARVCSLTRNYIIVVRPTLLQGKEDLGRLIINRWGDPMNANGIGAVIKRCVSLAQIKKNITTHTFRHTCATHMLRQGAPIRHVQELLGHESLDSTQIYTQVTINDLKRIHAEFHPGESMPYR